MDAARSTHCSSMKSGCSALKNFVCVLERKISARILSLWERNYFHVVLLYQCHAGIETGSRKRVLGEESCGSALPALEQDWLQAGLCSWGAGGMGVPLFFIICTFLLELDSESVKFGFKARWKCNLSSGQLFCLFIISQSSVFCWWFFFLLY